MPPPRVLMVTGAYFPELSGGGLQCKTIVSALKSDASFLVLTTSTDPSLPLEEKIDGTPVFRVPIDVRRIRSRVTAAVRIATLLARLRDRFDIVHLHGFSQKSLLVVLLARLLGKRIVLTIHTAGLDEWAGARATGVFASWCYSRADLFTAVSPRLTENYLAAGLPAERLWPVSNAVDVTRFRPATPGERKAIRVRLELTPGLIWILFVGFFSPEKAPDVLFDAWMTLQSMTPHLGLVFVGATRSPYFEVDGDLAGAIRDHAVRAGVDDRIRFVEPTPAVEDYFRAADIFVMPSSREGLPMVVLEAMACELPVVASRLEGVTDTFIEHRQNGILVPPRDAPAIAGAIRELVADPGFARRLGTSARVTIARRFGLRQAADRWLQVYGHVTNGRS